MAMKMDRRSFLKASAAVAVAVSMTGLLGGCSDGAIGTDFGLFQATAGAWMCNTNADDLGGVPETGWEGYIKVKVRIKDTSGSKKPQPVPAKGYFFLKINGQEIKKKADGGLLENGGQIHLTQGQFKEDWMQFTLTEEQRELYDTVIKKAADVTFIIKGGGETEIYKLNYETRMFVKTAAAE